MLSSVNKMWLWGSGLGIVLVHQDEHPCLGGGPGIPQQTEEIPCQGGSWFVASWCSTTGLQVWQETSEVPLGVAQGGWCLHSSPALLSMSAQSRVSDFPSLPPLGMQPFILLLQEAPWPFPPGEGAPHRAPAPPAPPGPSPHTSIPPSSFCPCLQLCSPFISRFASLTGYLWFSNAHIPVPPSLVETLTNAPTSATVSHHT